MLPPMIWRSMQIEMFQRLATKWVPSEESPDSGENRHEKGGTERSFPRRKRNRKYWAGQIAAPANP
ncbi:MAG: hypothetical protein DWH81_02150 [Planctomycetota bacterium]|nr:MAG: hypothetical protein DWH81_02150 [Planctomycetota bacterium]